MHRVQLLGVQRRRFSALVLGAASLGSVGLLFGVQACGSDSETTGKRVVLETEVSVDDVATTGFTTAVGWNVTLSKAVLSTGPFYYFDGAPPVVRLETTPLWRLALRRVVRSLGEGVAHAHPGHYHSGTALGEMIEPWSVDLLAGVTELPVGEGVTGTYRSARFSFTSPPVGPMAEALESHAALVEGVAERAGEPARAFRAIADLSDIERSAAEGHVEGCEFTELAIEGDGRVTLKVNPKVWFDLVDFAELEVAAGDARAEFPDDSQPKIAFAQGLAQLSAYKFSFAGE